MVSGEGFYFIGDYPGFGYSFGAGDGLVGLAGILGSSFRVYPHIHRVLRET